MHLLRYSFESIFVCCVLLKWYACIRCSCNGREQELFCARWLAFFIDCHKCFFLPTFSLRFHFSHWKIINYNFFFSISQSNSWPFKAKKFSIRMIQCAIFYYYIISILYLLSISISSENFHCSWSNIWHYFHRFHATSYILKVTSCY